MRVNVYSQELLPEARLVEKAGKEGETFSAVMLMVDSSPRLHQPPEHTGDEDDRSAITLWLPRSPERREALATTLEEMANLVRTAKSEIKSPQETIQLEVGQWYRMRKGLLTKIIAEIAEGTEFHHLGYRFFGGGSGQLYTTDGKAYTNDPNQLDDDIVAKASEEELVYIRSKGLL